MIFRKRKQEEPKGPQEVSLDWGIERHREATLQSTLFHIAARLTEMRFPNGADNEEDIVASFAKIHELLQDWFKGGPLKAEIQGMLEKLYPDPPGYEPGETLLPRGQEFPDHLGKYFEKKGWRFKD